MTEDAAACATNLARRLKASFRDEFLAHGERVASGVTGADG